jgi:two-component system, chemotaxis family, chemotaxis protein CheY
MANILVADDSGYARRLLRQALEQGAHTVLEASSGATAIESYFLHRPDLLLLDLTMGDLTGLEVMAQIRQLDADARVVVISADIQQSTKSEVLAAGAARFLGKPATPEAILAAVQSTLEGAVS